MAMRQTRNRIETAATLVRPHLPPYDAPELHAIHHDVHLAIIWMSENTTAPFQAALTLFTQAHYSGTTLPKAEMRNIAQLAISYLTAMSHDFTPQNYSAIYGLLERGLNA